MLTESQVWNSDRIMAANCEAGLAMPELMQLVVAVESEVNRAKDDRRSGLTNGRITEIAMTHAHAEDFARAIEAEVLQAQEPAALDKLLNDFAITCAFGSADERVSAATAIKSLFAAPQPTAPCPKCAQYEIDFALEHDDKIALQAKVAEQSAEIERLNSAYEAIDEQRNRDFETIAQQAERIMELERELTSEALKIKGAIDDNRKMLVDEWATKFAEQAALVERGELAADIYAAERNQATARYELVVRILSGIHALLYPPRFTGHDGRTWQFKSPIAEEQMQELSDRIRALPDEIKSIDAAVAAQKQAVEHHYKLPGANGYGEETGGLSTTVDAQKGEA